MNDLTSRPEYLALIEELARLAVEEHLRMRAEAEQESLPSAPLAA